MIKLRLARWFALALMTPATALPAQILSGQGVAPRPPSNDPADRLAANLLLLSQNPNDVRALTDAGLSAIAVGDGNAALAFLGRAEVLSPNNGRIKAGLGSALLLLEKPTDALKLFGEASALGVPEAELARERGLAYDLRGDSRRAQRDYALALRHDADDETTRRYALSLGISGDREKALEVLDPLLRRQDRAAWRARVFVLAMTGDLPMAEAVARQFMPISVATSLSPFLHRLAKLNPADRALAVNLGIMPGDGTQYAMVQTGDPYRSAGAAGNALIPAGDPLGTRSADPAPRQPAPDSRDPRRRPGAASASVAPATTAAAAGRGDPPSEPKPAALSSRLGTRIGPVDPKKVDEALRPFVAQKKNSVGGPARPGFSNAPSQLTVTRVDARELPPPTAYSTRQAPAPGLVAKDDASPPPVYEVSAPASAAQSLRPAPVSAPTAALMGPPSPQPSTQGALAVKPQVAAIVTPDPVASPTSQPSLALTSSRKPLGLGAIIATIEPEAESAAGPLPDEKALRAARAALQKKAAAANKVEAEAKAAKEKKDAEQLAAKKSPPRLWVQVATGANEAGLPLTWKRLRDKAPDALKGLSASSAPYKATNRLLVGPFKSPVEAKKVVNGLSKSGVSAMTFSSEAGQEIAKVAIK